MSQFVGAARHFLARWATCLGGFVVVSAAYLLGGLQFVDREFQDYRFRHVQMPASGSLVLVEIDGRSLDGLGSWPWPRRFHAEALNRLLAAGAQQVAFDIDFSSPSDEENDAALEAALAEASGRVVLPIFQQFLRSHGGNLDFRVTRPLARFERYAELASINVRPDSDGKIRRLPYVRRIGNDDYRSFAAALSGTDGAGEFLIDYGIDPSSVPRISLVDVLEGSFDPALVEGRRVLVGATAVELGDQLAVPVWRSLPGPMLNVLAYESLFQGRDIRQLGLTATLGLAMLVAFVFGPVFGRFGWRAGVATALAGVVGLAFLAFALHLRWAVSLDIVAAQAMLMLVFGVEMARRIDRQSLRLLIETVTNLHRQALLNQIVEASSDGVLIVGADGVVAMTNPAARQIFGLADFDGVRASDLFDHRDEDTSSTLEPLFTGQIGTTVSRIAEVTGLHSDGECIPLEVAITQVTSPASQPGMAGNSHQVCTVRDIRERKRIERLKQQAADDAMLAERSKSDFLATMSHELRTPLNHIIGFSEVLENCYFGELNDKQKEYAGNIAASGRDLLHLISEILEYSAVRDQDYELSEQEVSPHDILEGCLARVQDRARQGKLELVAVGGKDGLPRIRVDQAKIEQVLENLLSNSIKFNEEGGSVVLGVECGLDGWLSFSVEDTGIGMTDDQIRRALEPFARGEDAFQRTYDGCGLGLPLANAIIGLHGGVMEIESEPGKGTKVTVRLPPERVVLAGPNTTSAGRAGAALN